MRFGRLLLSLLFLAYLAADSGAAAIRDLPGFNSFKLPRNDDEASDFVPIGFTVSFYGKTHSNLYVNNNGNITFDAPSGEFRPRGIIGANQEMIGVFYADVDTRNLASGVVTYGQDVVNGRKAFGVNYINVGYFDSHADKLNSFQ